jgi:hypothetical protein
MSSRPVCKIIPSAKLTADNAGDVELSAHRRAITATSAALQPQSTPSSLSNPLEPTSVVATGTASDQDHQVAPSLALTKRPHARPILPTTSLETLADDMEPDDTPKVKKAKVTLHQAESGVQGDISIIEIDNGDDEKNKQLNKVDKAADIKAFFTFHSEERDANGEVKVFMKCTPCA